MTYYDLHNCFEELIATGTVQIQYQKTFSDVLEFLLHEGEQFFENCDKEIDETDTFSYYNIELIRNGAILDLELAEYLEYVAKDIISSIEAMDEVMGTNWKTKFGW